jgi:hypothetical protein
MDFISCINVCSMYGFNLCTAALFCQTLVIIDKRPLIFARKNTLQFCIKKASKTIVVLLA